MWNALLLPGLLPPYLALLKFSLSHRLRSPTFLMAKEKMKKRKLKTQNSKTQNPKLKTKAKQHSGGEQNTQYTHDIEPQRYSGTEAQRHSTCWQKRHRGRKTHLLALPPKPSTRSSSTLQVPSSATTATAGEEISNAAAGAASTTARAAPRRRRRAEELVDCPRSARAEATLSAAHATKRVQRFAQLIGDTLEARTTPGVALRPVEHSSGDKGTHDDDEDRPHKHKENGS